MLAALTNLSTERSKSRFRRSRSRGISNDQLDRDLILLALGVGRAGEFVERVGGQPAQSVAMNVHGGDRWVAVFGEAYTIEPCNGDILGHAAARVQ
jgi:hypothetical protein